MKSEPKRLHPIRGGMSPHAFAGHDRLDKLDLSGPSEVGGKLLDVTSNVQPERLLWLTSIQDAVQNYLPWGLGRNGTTGHEFWYATKYFFHVQATDSSIAWPVGTTRTLTCLSRASRIPAIKQAPR
jgi:hypothetical protein